MKVFFFTLLFFFPLFMVSQDCNCEAVFVWAKKTFEENDAGFSFVIENKGWEAYKSHSDETFEKVKQAGHPSECAEVISDWLGFFRTGHVAFVWVGEENETTEEVDTTPALNWEQRELERDKLDAYFESLEPQGYEGIWEPLNKREKKTESIVILKSEEGFKGYILDSSEEGWTQGELKINLQAREGRLKATYFYPNRSAQVFQEVVLMGEHYLQMGPVILKRKGPYKADEAIEAYIDLFLAREPRLQRLDEATLLFRIPSFALQHKAQIDQLIEESHEALLTTPNLILDLRNNGGGSDASFDEVFPFLYTNPVRMVGAEFLATALNTAVMKNFAELPDLDEETREWAQEAYEKVCDQSGTFVNIFEEVVTLAELDEVYENPRQVAILIDQKCGSTTEEFLLAAKQSKKVKLYGTTTAGVLDFANMNVVDSPCEQFRLGYAMSRSLRIPGMAIDGKGIQPDFFLDQSIAPYEWIDFVRENLRQ